MTIAHQYNAVALRIEIQKKYRLQSSKTLGTDINKQLQLLFAVTLQLLQ